MFKCVFWIKLVIPYNYVYFIRRGGQHRGRANSFHTTKKLHWIILEQKTASGAWFTKKNCIWSLIYCSGPGHSKGTLLYPCRPWLFISSFSFILFASSPRGVWGTNKGTSKPPLRYQFLSWSSFFFCLLSSSHVLSWLTGRPPLLSSSSILSNPNIPDFKSLKTKDERQHSKVKGQMSNQ